MKKLLPLLLLLAGTAFAQTGTFERTFLTVDPSLSGDSLTVYCYVPSTYNPNVPSKMIMGFHGLGNPDNSAQIRQYLTPLGDSINAIVICPDPYLQDQPKSEVVLNLAYDSALVWFNVDTNNIYITGYSAGSDVAAQYFFGEPSHLMKGLIWHSPGFFFNPDLSNPQEIPPVCLCTGTNDFTSIIQTGILNNSLDGSSFPYLYNEIPGVDHTMEYPTFPEEMMECINFIDANSTVGTSENPLSKLKAYPNPINGNEDLSIMGLSGETTIQLFDITGKQVKNYVYKQVDDKLRLPNLGQNLSAGVYVLSISSQGHKVNRKLLIQ